MQRSILMLLANGFHPDPRVHKEANSLLENGFDVAIVCLDRDCRLPRREVVGGIEIRRVRVGVVKPGEHLSVARALTAFYLKALGEALAVNRRRRIDLVHCNDFDTVALGLVLKRLWNIPLVYDMHDLYASFIKNDFLRGLVQKVDDHFYSRVDAMLIVNDDFRRLPRLDADRATVVMNVPDKKGAGICADTDVGLFYAGNLDLLRDMRYAMTVFEECGFNVELAGDGPLLREYRATTNSDRIALPGRISPDEVRLRTSRCKAVIALYDTAYPNNRLASPNKLFDAMKFGKPAIVSEGTVMARIVEELECGLVVPYGDREELSAAIGRLKEEKQYRRMCENAFAAHRERFNWEIMASRMTKLYRELVGDRAEGEI
jgi:glycosyltransferase involved in cell wall biosynthesis